MVLYNHLQKKISSGLGDRSPLDDEIPYRRYSPRPAYAADLVKFQNRQYSLDERRTRIMIRFFELYVLIAPEEIPGLFVWQKQFKHGAAAGCEINGILHSHLISATYLQKFSLNIII